MKFLCLGAFPLKGHELLAGHEGYVCVCRRKDEEWNIPVGIKSLRFLSGMHPQPL